jgi:hypothetical protein
MEVSGHIHAPAALSPGQQRRYPFDMIWGWVGPRAGLDAVAKRKMPISAPAGNRTPIVQSVGYSLYWLSQINNVTM